MRDVSVKHSPENESCIETVSNSFLYISDYLHTDFINE